MTPDARDSPEQPVVQGVKVPKVRRESPSVVPVHLDHEALLETRVLRVLLGSEEILEVLVPLGLQDRRAAKEIQESVEVQAPRVWWAPQGPVAGRVFQDFLGKPVVTVLRDRRARRDSKGLRDRWDFTDWTD